MSTLLFVAGQPNGRNEIYDADELERLATKYPDKMVYANGKLHSTAPVEDDDHRFRWDVSIAHHVEQIHAEDRHAAVTQILEGVKVLEKQLACRVGWWVRTTAVWQPTPYR
jgi:hypothetical protein